MSEPQQHPSLPTSDQIAAMISMLGDDHARLWQSARKRLLAWGEPAVEHLRAGAEVAHVPTRARCRSLLRTMELQQVLRQLDAIRPDLETGSSTTGLLNGAVLVARLVRTFVPSAASQTGRLRSAAAGLRKAAEGRSLPVQARLLAERMVDELGLGDCGIDLLERLQREVAGGASGQSVAGRRLTDRLLLDRVLQLQEGAPISLSMLYLLVARWAGMAASGVAMPDHFLVRVHGPRPLLLDPFNGGRVVTKSDCMRQLRRSGYKRPSDHLGDVSDRELLRRYADSVRSACRDVGAESGAALDVALEQLSL